MSQLEGDMNWKSYKVYQGRNHALPAIDASLSNKATTDCEFANARTKAIAGRLENITRKGIVKGCNVVVRGKSRVYVVKEITSENFLMLVGVSCKCTPYDYDLAA